MPEAKLSPRLAAYTAAALTPEHLVPYVLAMGGGTPCPCGEGIGYLRDGRLVLAVCPSSGTTGGVSGGTSGEGTGETCGESENPGRLESIAAAVDASVERALALPGVERITVLAPCRPSAAPQDAVSRADQYWGLPLPVQAPVGRAGQKWRNTLVRAQRDVTLHSSDPAALEAGASPFREHTRGNSQGSEMGKRMPGLEIRPGSGPQKADQWTREHAELVEGFLRSRPLGPGSATLFRRIGAYLEAVPDALLFSARSASGRLEGLCVGDCSALSTAFYLFAFRRPDSPPGTADLLLAALAETAAARGHSRLNLGLGINAGIAFFKRKWGATPILPHMETSWTPARAPWWRKWF